MNGTEFMYFLAGIIWGVMVVTPILTVIKTIWKNAKEAQNGNTR